MGNVQLPVDEVNTIADGISKYGFNAMILAVLIIVLLIIMTAFIFVFMKQSKNLMKQNEELTSNLIKYKQDNGKIEIKKETVESYTTYTEMLKEMCSKTHNLIKADRVAIYVFHNGQVSLSGFPFMKTSCISEWVTYSEYSRIHIHRDIMINLFTGMISELVDKGEYIILDTDVLKSSDPIMYRLIEMDRIESTFVNAITDSDNKLIGYVCAEFISRKVDVNLKDTINDELNELSLRANPLLELSKESKKSI